MKKIANLLFQANLLKKIPRSGYHFLAAGKESVAEHTYSAAFIAWIVSKLDPDADALKLITMCLLHDLVESRTGDLNLVQKKYVIADEATALEDTMRSLPFGQAMRDIIQEFNAGQTLEAKLARDADQLALILDLKCLSDLGYEPPKRWLPHVLARLETDTGKKIAAGILTTQYDEWWLNNLVDSREKKK